LHLRERVHKKKDNAEDRRAQVEAHAATQSREKSRDVVDEALLLLLDNEVVVGQVHTQKWVFCVLKTVKPEKGYSSCNHLATEEYQPRGVINRRAW
jgi:hypothetical protein